MPSGIVYVDGLSVGDTSQDVLDERNTLGNQGFASVAAAVDVKRKQVVGEVQVSMHGITGGTTTTWPRSSSTVAGALRKCLGRTRREGAAQGARDSSCRFCGTAPSSVPWWS